MAADPFSSGLMAGYAFVDNIYARRQQLALQKREMDRQDRFDQMRQVEFNDERRRRRLAEADSVEQRAASIVRGAVQQYGDDEAKWDPGVRGAAMEAFQQADSLRSGEDGSASTFGSGGLVSRAAATDSSLGQYVQQRRIGQEVAADLQTVNGFNGGSQQAAPAPAQPRPRPAPAPVPPRAPAAPAPAQAAPAAAPAPTQAAPPPPPRSALGAAQAAADEQASFGGMLRRATDAVKGLAANYAWDRVLDLNDKNPVIAEIRRNPTAAVGRYAADRARLPREKQTQLDAHFVPAMKQRINELNTKLTELSSQPPPESTGAISGVRVALNRREVRQAERELGQLNSALRDAATKFSASSQLGIKGSVPAGPQLLDAVANGVTAPPPGKASPARLRSDARTLVSFAQQPGPQNNRTAAAAASGNAAVRAGMSAPSTSGVQGVARPAQLSKDVLDAATRLLSNGAINAETYTNLLRYGRMDAPVLIQQLSGYDPTKAQVVTINGKQQIIPPNPAYLRASMAGANAAYKERVKWAEAEVKAATKLGESNMKFVENASKAFARQLSGDDKDRVSWEDVSTQFVMTMSDPDVAGILRERGIDPGTVNGRGLAKMTEPQLAALWGVFRDFYTAKDEYDNDTFTISKILGIADAPDAKQMIRDGLQTAPAAMSRDEWQQRVVQQLLSSGATQSDIDAVPEDAWSAQYAQEFGQ